MINKFNITECLEETLYSIQVLKDTETVVEARILNTNKGTISGYYDDYEKFAKDIKPYVGKYNIYFTINPVKKELLARSRNHLTEYTKATTTDIDIEKRAILMIDLDAKRPSGISSSDKEHQKAMKKAKEIKNFLTEQGWSEPVVTDSGNGAHLLYFIDLPNDKASTELVQNVLKALDKMFTDDAVEVDKSTFNAARICKVYGSVACKGDDTPAVRDVVSMPTSKEDLALILSNNYMPCFDNLDNITAEKSDMLCMAATGGGFSKRTLYSDDDETILYFKEPVSLNGINVVATRADLLDRSILLELERIPPEERKEESAIWNEFERDKPKILGAIFTTLSKAMSIYDTVKLDRMGRMADFTRWGYAIAEAAGIGGEVFLDAYLNNQNRANDEAVESNPIAAAIIKLMNDTNRWDGTVARLLGELNRIAERESINTHSKLWANEANVLSRRLKEVKSNLELIGIQYTIRHHSVGKKITIIKGNENKEIVRPMNDVDEVVDDGFDELFSD